MRRLTNPGNFNRDCNISINGNDELEGKNLTESQRNYLRTNGIKYHDGNILEKLQVLLFSQDDNGDIASYFDGKRVCLDWNSPVIVKRDELWICYVTMNSEKLGYAKPLHKISPSEILEINGKIEQIAEYMWKKRPKEVAKHVDVSDELAKIDELVGDFEDLEDDYESVVKELKKKEDAEKTLRSEMEEGHRKELEKFKEDYEKSEKDLIDKYNAELKILKNELDEFNLKNQKSSKENDDFTNNEEVQNLKEEIESLRNENKTLNNQIIAKNDEITRKMSESVLEKRTISDYYEDKIESLERKLEEFNYELLTSSRMSDPFVNAKSTGVGDMKHSSDEKDSKIENLQDNLSKLSERLEDLYETTNDLEYKVKSSVTVDGENTITRTLFTMSGTVVRVSIDEFKCSLIDEGTYAVKINADRNIMRFVPDKYGSATCFNGIIRVPDLNLIKVLENKLGELNWRMVNGNTLEVSI